MKKNFFIWLFTIAMITTLYIVIMEWGWGLKPESYGIVIGIHLAIQFFSQLMHAIQRWLHEKEKEKEEHLCCGK